MSFKNRSILWNSLKLTALAALVGMAFLAAPADLYAAGVKQFTASPAIHARTTRSYVTPYPERDRYQMVILGDSLGDGIWAGLYQAFRKNRNVKITKKSKVSTGFVRKDYYDWQSALGKILKGRKYHIAVVMFGANDRQGIRIKRRKWLKVGSGAWRKAYRQRVDKFIKKLKTRNVAVYWVGVPIVRSPKFARDMAIINDIYRERALANGVKFIDVWNSFADKRGRYSAYGPDITGKTRRLRANDGIHFTMRGYRKLAHFAEREIRRDLAYSKAETEVPLAGDEVEQAKLTGKQVSATVARRAAEDRRKAAKRKYVAAGLAGTFISAPLEIPETAPRRSTLSALAGDEVIRLTSLASLSSPATLTQGIGQSGVASNTPLERVLVRGERPESKPGRADDFSWPRR